MSDDGLDINELTNFEKDLMKFANDTMPKESRKFIKQQGTKLTKKNKEVFKNCGIGTGDSKEFEKNFKTGKVYKYDGAYSVRAFNGDVVTSKDGKYYSLGGILNNGFIHKARDGSETFVPGYHFMEKARKDFQNTYYDECEKFVDKIIDKINE